MPPTPRTLYRRAHKSQMPDGRRTRGWFTPTDRDIDGISLYDASVVTPEEVKEAADKPANEYRVVELAESVFLELGLLVGPTEDASAGELPGHVSVPGFNFHAYQQDKRRFRPIQDRLLEAAKFAD